MVSKRWIWVVPTLFGIEIVIQICPMEDEEKLQLTVAIKELPFCIPIYTNHRVQANDLSTPILSQYLTIFKPPHRVHPSGNIPQLPPLRPSRIPALTLALFILISSLQRFL